ncbi:MAG: type II toxin-antitoxin system VapC family toxin [Bacteroidota bacterium]
MKERLIDTDIFSYYLKGDREVVQKLLEYLKHFPLLNLSSITHYEILSGLYYKKATKQIETFQKLLTRCRIINIDADSIAFSAKEYGRLRRVGITISNSDLLIAGTAVKNDFILSTNNTKHFKHIKGLVLTNWKEGQL